jgi:hypothetical protein
MCLNLTAGNFLFMFVCELKFFVFWITELKFYFDVRGCLLFVQSTNTIFLVRMLSLVTRINSSISLLLCPMFIYLRDLFIIVVI